MSMEELYRTLRKLVSDKFMITIRDGVTPEVALTPDSQQSHPWTHFKGQSIEDALMRAVTKLRNPGDDYRAEPTCIDRGGHLWKADEGSIYSEDHTRLFLRE